MQFKHFSAVVIFPQMRSDVLVLHFFIYKLPVCLSRISSKPFCCVSAVVVLQSLRCVQHFATPWTAARSLSFAFSWSSLTLLSTVSVMPSNHLILCCPLLLLPSVFPSLRIFSNEWTLHQVAEVLVFQLPHHFFQRILRVDFL